MLVIPELVDDCRLRCQLCWNAKRKPSGEVMPLSLVDRIVNVYRRHWIAWYNWGDPVLHPDLGGVADRIKNTKSIISSTFSSSLSNAQIDAIRSFRTVIYSISGMTAKTAGIYHRGIDYNISRKNLARISPGLANRLVIRWLCHPENEHELEQCRRMANDLNASLDVVEMTFSVEDQLAGADHNMLGHRKQTARTCLALDRIPISVQGEYLLCCHTRNVLTGLTIDDEPSLEDIKQAKLKHPLCQQCRDRDLWRMYF